MGCSESNKQELEDRFFGPSSNFVRFPLWTIRSWRSWPIGDSKISVWDLLVGKERLEIARRNDGEIMERVEVEGLAISGNEIVRLCGERTSENDVVGGISADPGREARGGTNHRGDGFELPHGGFEDLR